MGYIMPKPVDGSTADMTLHCISLPQPNNRDHVKLRQNFKNTFGIANAKIYIT